MAEQSVPNLEEMNEQEAHRFLTELFSNLSAQEEYELRHQEDYVMEISGRMKVVADDGSEMEIGLGDAYAIPPGHDAWIVGDEPATGIELSPEAVE